ncbi:hypothetical protein ACF0H5_016717 [Mactra antiquata]
MDSYSGAIFAPLYRWLCDSEALRMNKQEIKTKFQCILEKLNKCLEFSLYDYISNHVIKPYGLPTLNDSVYFLLVGCVGNHFSSYPLIYMSGLDGLVWIF